MPRRGENIRRRKDGRWEARYPSGITETGAKKYTSVYGRTYQEVKKKQALALERRGGPPVRQKGIPLFRAFWDYGSKVTGSA